LIKLIRTMSNKTPKLKKISLKAENLKLLQQLTGLKIYTKNVLGIPEPELDKLLAAGQTNSLVYLQRYNQGHKLSLLEEQTLFQSLVTLQQVLGLQRIPVHIECYDISHFAGKFVYGAMVVFVDGRPAKKLYRVFKTAQKNDDYANLQEVLRRRLQNWLDHQNQPPTIKLNLSTTPIYLRPWELPNLMIIDGGKGQLSVVNEVIQEFKQQYPQIEVELCALAKKEEEVFVLNRPDSIKFTGEVKFLLQRIRDEAHRFGLTHSRKALVKQSAKSQLDEIPSIGTVTKQKLLATFGSVENVINMFYEQPNLLRQILTQKQFDALTAWLQNRPTS